jgi:hypothetical protein
VVRYNLFLKCFINAESRPKVRLRASGQNVHFYPMPALNKLTMTGISISGYLPLPALQTLALFDVLIEIGCIPQCIHSLLLCDSTLSGHVSFPYLQKLEAFDVWNAPNIQAMIKAPLLSHLEMGRRYGMGKAFTTLIEAYLGGTTSLRYLLIRREDVGNSIHQYLQSQTQLQTLVFIRCDIPKTFITALVRAFPQLTTLKLSRCCVARGSYTSDQLRRELAASRPSLQISVDLISHVRTALT